MKYEKIVLAFLQNGWYGNARNAARAQLHYDHVAKDYKARQYMTRYGIFAGCMTGRRLRDIYGKDLCDHILWENATTKCAGDLGKLAPEPEHICKAIEYHQPEVIIAFGSCFETVRSVVLTLSIRPSDFCPLQIIRSPHPVSRCKNAGRDLEEAMLNLKRALGL